MTAQPFEATDARQTIDLIAATAPGPALNTAAMVETLQAIMADDVGPLRTGDKLERALAATAQLTEALGATPCGDARPFDLRRLEWFDLRDMLLVAGVVTEAALKRTESRGAHQREDFASTLPEWRVNQVAHWREGRLAWSTLRHAPAMAAQ